VVDQLTEIVWDSDAFAHLVLSEEKKSLVKSLVNADQTEMIKDVISCKSGGFLVVLHGKPGTGKTLTAEAAAEKAQKPLMVASGAELGMSDGFSQPGYAHSLHDILDLCKTWDAILLIDEAEVYLEARSLGDIRRNATVSNFLRQLEYHQQVIFLTTNHISRLDAAFKSRIAVAIRYPDLNADAQEEIWSRFLTLADIPIVEDENWNEQHCSITRNDLAKLATRQMNGRYSIW
jgi:SpoVK/Ycf46/Vps4 family AAA+-type ATPase